MRIETATELLIAIMIVCWLRIVCKSSVSVTDYVAKNIYEYITYLVVHIDIRYNFLTNEYFNQVVMGTESSVISVLIRYKQLY